MKKKSLAKNSLFNVAYRGFTALFPLVTTTYISRVLLPEGVGRVAYANTIVAYFVLIASLGIPSYGVKAIAQSNEDKEKCSKTFFELFGINLSATLLCIAAYYLFVGNVSHFADRRELFYIMGLMLVLNIFNIDWFYQGIEEYGYIALRSLIVKVLSFVAMLLFVHKKSDYLIYALILCIATGGNNLLNALHLRRYVTFPREGLKIGQHLRPVLVLLASTIATEVYTMLDTVMLEYFHGDTSVGYYSNAVKIVRMTYTVVIALVAVFYPRISMYYKQREQEACNALLTRGTEILMVLALPCVAGLALTADGVITLVCGTAFLPAVGTLQILSVLVFIFSIAYFLGHIILTATGMERRILYASVTGAIVNVCANTLLIPRFAQNGAAIASVLSEFAVTGILLWHSRKYYQLAVSRRFMGSLLSALAVMTAVTAALVCLLTDVLTVQAGVILLVIAAAAAVYFGSLLLLKNPLAQEAVDKVRGKLGRR